MKTAAQFSDLDGPITLTEVVGALKGAYREVIRESGIPPEVGTLIEAGVAEKLVMLEKFTEAERRQPERNGGHGEA